MRRPPTSTACTPPTPAATRLTPTPPTRRLNRPARAPRLHSFPPARTGSTSTTAPTRERPGARPRSTTPPGRAATQNWATTTTQPPPTNTALPSPWNDGDIGTGGLAGSASFANNTFTVGGSGNDIWFNADGLHYVYQPLAGDGTIVAKVNGLQNTNAWA